MLLQPIRLDQQIQDAISGYVPPELKDKIRTVTDNLEKVSEVNGDPVTHVAIEGDEIHYNLPHRPGNCRYYYPIQYARIGIQGKPDHRKGGQANMSSKVLNALEQARDYVELMMGSAASEDDGEQALLTRINAAIQEQVRYIPIIRLTRGEFEMMSPDASGLPQLTDDDLKRIAEKACDALCDNGFWDILGQVISEYRKQEASQHE